MASQIVLLKCRDRYRYLSDRRKERIERLKSYLRSIKLKPMLQHDYSESCVTDLVRSATHTADRHRRGNSDVMLRVISKKREYAIEYIARRQLVNTKNRVLARIKKRFFGYKKNFQPRTSVAWVRDLPLKPNLNNHTFFGWNVQKDNRSHLHDTYAKAFGILVQGFELLQEHTYVFKIARCLNKLAYCINAFDWGEYNSLNFIFRIYKRQNYDFDSMVREITSADILLPSPDPAVLCDNFVSLFGRINYFDYNDVTGEMGDCYDNALFVLRAELYPFLVAEYVLVRFILTRLPSTIADNMKLTLRENFENDSVVGNVCQCYPGVFTLLFLIYFDNADRSDDGRILNMLLDCHSSAMSMEYDRVTLRLKGLARFICETVYSIEQGHVVIPKSVSYIMSQPSFFKYNYLVQMPSANIATTNLSSLPFLVRGADETIGQGIQI
ncbi:MAG: hypothetical protein ABW185_00515 [Sedimenticola sp.]